jgi:hypothetical protein
MNDQPLSTTLVLSWRNGAFCAVKVNVFAWRVQRIPISRSLTAAEADSLKQHAQALGHEVVWA